MPIGLLQVLRSSIWVENTSSVFLSLLQEVPLKWQVLTDPLRIIARLLPSCSSASFHLFHKLVIGHLNEVTLLTFPDWMSTLWMCACFLVVLPYSSTMLFFFIYSFLRLTTWFSNPSDIFQSNLRTRWLVSVSLRNAHPAGSRAGGRWRRTGEGALPASCGQRCPAPAVAPEVDRSCPQWDTGSKAPYFVRPVIAAGELRDINPFEMPLLILAVLFLRARVSPPLKPTHFIRYCKWLHLQF